MKRILVVGASGLVGSGLLNVLRQRGYDVVGTYRAFGTKETVHLDISARREAAQFLREVNPTAVMIPAALADVEYCETHPRETWRANVEDLLAFVQHCDEIPLVYFSSEYVFDGTGGPYAESAMTNPLSHYGNQKVAVERELLCRSHTLIVRTVHVFGPELQKKNFVSRLIRTLRAGQAIAVASDQISTPTYNPQLSAAAVSVFEAGLTGIVHLTGRDRMSRYEFALAAARAFNLDESLVRPILTAELSQHALRPLSAGLISERVDYAQLGLTGVGQALESARSTMS